jgi:multisubunit Na+/H+ antiporter MnhG subunit
LTRLGLAISQFIGRLLLLFFFFFILTPVGLILRLAGKDALQLRPPREATTYWQPAKAYGPLDRLF